MAERKLSGIEKAFAGHHEHKAMPTTVIARRCEKCGNDSRQRCLDCFKIFCTACNNEEEEGI